MKFADISGLEDVKQRLTGAINNNHIAHAQLFLSKNGGSNLPLALAYATYLNCEQHIDNDSCGTCPSCSKNNKFVHPDVHFVFPVSATKNITGKDVISINFLPDWRTFLIENPYRSVNEWANTYGGENKQVNISKEESRQVIKNLSLKAFGGKYKVMIIWLPEYMNSAAANGILKILEEPPEGTVFLLACNDDEKLLTTILSRTQIVKIRPLSDREMSTLLMDKSGVEEAKANQIAYLANGNVDDAFTMINGEENESQSMFKEWMRICFKKDVSAMVLMAEDFQKMNKIDQRNIFQYGVSTMREALITNLKVPEVVKVTGEERAFVENFGKVLDTDKVMDVTGQLNEALYHLERNASPKITFLDLSLQIAKRLK
jgi:DNA polymerase-3 subunit delta'